MRPVIRAAGHLSWRKIFSMRWRRRSEHLVRLDLPERRWITPRDRRQFHGDGYMVIPNVVPLSLVSNAVVEICAFVGADLRNSATWYNGPPELDGIVPLHHAQSLWDIRQCENLYEVFAEFF